MKTVEEYRAILAQQHRPKYERAIMRARDKLYRVESARRDDEWWRLWRMTMEALCERISPKNVLEMLAEIRKGWS